MSAGPPMDALAARFAKVSTPHVCDALAHVGLANVVMQGARPVTLGGRGSTMAGPAVTLELVPARTRDAPRRLGPFLDDVVGPGSVAVIAAHGYVAHVAVGGRAAMRAHVRGANGMVVDGGIRDVAELQQGSLPVFATGFGLPASEGFLEGIRINEPVHCAGVKVESGDWVVGDDSGVVVIPAAEIDKVLSLAEEREEVDRASVVELAAGATLAETHRHFHDDDPSWLRHVE